MGDFTTLKKNPIILALDGLTQEKAIDLIDKLIEAGFYNDGFWGIKLEDPHLNNYFVISKFLERGIRVFSDPKLVIALPERAGNIVAAYALADIISVCSWVTISAMREAVKISRSSRLAALLVPTSFDEVTCQIIFGKTLEVATYEFALRAKYAGIRTLICPPRELTILKKHEDEFRDMLKITPAIRPSWYKASHGHQETLTPKQALDMGADFLVIGSPITKASDPVRAMKVLCEEVRN